MFADKLSTFKYELFIKLDDILYNIQEEKFEHALGNGNMIEKNASKLT